MNQALSEILKPITVPASWVYAAAIASRNRGFDRGRNVWKVDRPVISVGNVTMGGVGKSPMVAWIAELLMRQGHAPVIAMRGYGARPPEPSDEEAEYALRLPDVPVVADPDRLSALRRFLDANPAVDSVLLDDGFQHRRLARDLDLVLIDATRETLGDRLLPAGFLREPPSALRRADAVVVTRAVRVDDAIDAKIRAAHGRPPVAWSRHVWTDLTVSAPDPRREPVQWLAGKRVLTMLGVAHPASIVAQLEEAGAVVAVDVPARDHERFSPSKLERARGLAAELDAVVFTAKDWVRVQNRINLHHWPAVVVPRLAIDVFEGAEALKEKILKSLES